MTRDVSVNVLVFGGADSDPPPNLGSADRTRYVKVTGLDEVVAQQLLDGMQQAGRTPGWN